MNKAVIKSASKASVTLRGVLSLLLALCLVIGMATVALADSGGHTDTIKFSHDPHNTGSLVGGDGYIEVTGLPSDEDYSYIRMLLFRSGISKAVADETFAGSERIKFSFSLSDGDYYFEMYHNADRYGEYDALMWGKDFPVSIKGGVASFPLSPVYDSNVSIFTPKRADATAAEYYLRPSRFIQSDDAEVRATAEGITRGISGDYDKARAIHDWVAGNIYYDYSLADVILSTGGVTVADSSATEVLATRRGVCEGFSNLTAALLRAVGIPAKKVSGFALGLSTTGEWTPAILSGSRQTNHAWNEALIGGRWVILDTTWDSDNEYYSAADMIFGGMRYRKYFDPTMELFSADHMLADYSEDVLREFVIEGGKLTAYNGIKPDVVIPVGVSSIGARAFDDITITSVAIHAGVELIEGFAFTYHETSRDNPNMFYIHERKDFTILGSPGTYAESYAKARGIKFAPLLLATPSETSFIMDGKAVSVPEAYSISETNYLQLRGIAVLMNGTAAQFNVFWDGEYAVIETGKPFTGSVTPASLKETGNLTPSSTKFKIDGKVTTIENAYLIDGNTNYLQLREVAERLIGTASQFNVYWDSAASRAVIEPGKPYTGVK
ncbi:MAG: transglutaminase-like domain-containing protein [Oscillospiraceae bacterium]|jgi:hypothetical protein|nr:transglutaminase-like domain-containing protein [Oscillospiraceae bacterium]